MTPLELRRVFHEQVRLHDRDVAAGFVFERSGPVRRSYPADPAAPGAMIESPQGLGGDPRGVIGEQAAFFTERGQSVEWKTYSYDSPANLGTLLVWGGFLPEDPEALLLGEASALTGSGAAEGIVVRDIEAGADLDWERVGHLHDVIWGPRKRWATDGHRAELAQTPDLMVACVAEDPSTSTMVGFGVLRVVPDTQFAGLWGGGVHPRWRRRGVFRSLVAHRARRALDAGYPLIRVDASAMSAPILRRLGLTEVATTTPYVHTP